MATEYELGTKPTDDEAQQVTITSTEEVTTVKKVSVAQLKQRHTQILGEIERMEDEADKIVNEIQAIADNTAVTVDEIPDKLR